MTSLPRGHKESPSYVARLRESSRNSGSLLCLGIDPVLDYVPEEFTGSVTARVVGYYAELFRIVKERGAVPGAFKPNIGFFHVLDRPREGDFSGSAALATLLGLLGDEFPGVPVILDAKRGDIARSSTNYGREAFDSWGADAVTISPYMGDDSVLAIAEEARRVGGLVYVLAATSNPGARRFQSLKTERGAPVAVEVARAVAGWHVDHGVCGTVVGGTRPEELGALLKVLAPCEVPLLIPGVGSQGGTPESIMNALSRAEYPKELARINVSSGITHPWKEAGAPGDWREVVGDSLAEFHRRLG